MEKLNRRHNSSRQLGQEARSGITLPGITDVVNRHRGRTDIIHMLGLAEDVADTMILAEALFLAASGGEVTSHPVSAAAVVRIIGLMEEVRAQTPWLMSSSTSSDTDTLI